MGRCLSLRGGCGREGGGGGRTGDHHLDLHLEVLVRGAALEEQVHVAHHRERADLRVRQLVRAARIASGPCEDDERQLCGSARGCTGRA